MKFPRPEAAPFTAVSCRTASKARAAMLGRISALTTALKIPHRPAHQAAAMIYLGLWTLRQAQLDKKQVDARKGLLRADELYLPERNGGDGVNCSHYSDGSGTIDNKPVTYIGHRPAIDAAMGVFVPDIKALKKRCFLLVELGSHFSKSALSEPSLHDDAWLESFEWESFDFES